MKAQTATLSTYVNGEPFVIKGDYEAVADQLVNADRHLEALQASEARQVRKVSGLAGKTAVEAPTMLTGRKATIAAKLYDLANGSSMYDLLKQKRREERDLAMAKKLGLITTDRCAKHEKQLAAVRGMQ